MASMDRATVRRQRMEILYASMKPATAAQRISEWRAGEPMDLQVVPEPPELKGEPWVRIPKKFLEDHAERDLPGPLVLRETQSHYYVSAADHAVGELIDDANYYTTPWAFDGETAWDLRGVINSAVATLKAFEKAGYTVLYNDRATEKRAEGRG